MRRAISHAAPLQNRRRRALILAPAVLIPILALTLVVSHLQALPARATGSLSFAPHVDSTVGTSPRSVAVGDFNGDGHPDLAAAGGGSTVNVLLNTGAGTFAPHADYPVSIGSSPGAEGAGATSVAVGDFNGDRKLDLVVTDSATVVPNTDPCFSPTGIASSVSLLLGNGDGTFQTHVETLTCHSSSSSVAVGDFNQDGNLDVVTANADDTVSVLLGNGGGAFAAPVNYSLTQFSHPVSLAVADFNGDGLPDLATANFQLNTVSVLLNSGGGAFAAAVDYPAVSFNAGLNGPVSLAVADFNGDGLPDLATANGTIHPGSISVLLNSGGGAFATPVLYLSADPLHPAAEVPFVAVGDFNGDGHPDVAAASPWDPSNGNVGFPGVSVWLSNGGGNLEGPLGYFAGINPISVVVADFNGDGMPDLAIGNGDDTVSVLLNTTGSSPAPTPSPTPGGGSSSTTTTLGLTGGNLSASTTAAPTLNAALTGLDQTVSYTLPITVTDATGTGNGWNLTLTSTQFSTGGAPAHTLPTSASLLTGATSACVSGATCVDPTNTVTYPLGVPAGASAPPPVKLFNAAANTGLGAFTVTSSVSIFIPAGTYAGSYTSAITLAIVSGP